MGISLIVLVITIIVIIILAAAVILTLTNNNPITNAKQASFVNDLDSFKSELDMYKASEYAKRIGDFEQTSLQGTEGSLTFEGQTPEEAGIQTMYTAIPSLKGISKYQGQFAIKDGQLVYMGTDTDKIGWAASVGVGHEVAGEPKIVSIPPAQTFVEPATDVVYTIRVTSTATLTMISDLSSKIKVTDISGVALPTQPGIELGNVTGSDTVKEFTVTVQTTSLPYGTYKIKVESGIATNAENVPNQEYITVNAFEVADNTPPEVPEISAVPATEYTSGNVVVTIDYKDADVKLYSFTGNTGDWQTYTSALTITTNNTTVYAMGKDSSGNETGLVTKTIANIDKTAPENAVFNLIVNINESKISGTITLADNESGINLSQSKHIVTTQATAYATNATDWSTATVFTTNPQSISVTKENGAYYVPTLSVDNVGNKRVNVSNQIVLQDYVATTETDPEWYSYTNISTGVVAEVNVPQLAQGMTPIKYPSELGNTARWANAITADGSMWVWIPRYEYQIPTPHSSTAQTIAVNFINGTGTTPTSGYTIHPAFDFGGTQLTGIWVAKFEASGTTSAVDVKPGVASLMSITINAMFTACRNMENNTGKYGWSTTGLDTHLMKNVEWGAVAYLSSSAYGKTGEITINDNSSYLTGGGTTNSYTTNVSQSTTGNVYGIYDMSGCARECTAAYVNNGHGNLTTYGASVVSAAAKYKDVYVSSGDTMAGNYSANSTKKGDAVYETSTSGDATTSSWYVDYSYMPYSHGPFFTRGGSYTHGANAGAFAFSYYGGDPNNGYGFRPVVVLGSGL